MKFVLYTNSVSAHQLPLAREIARRVGPEDFRYVYTGATLQGGAQEVAASDPWVVREGGDETRRWLEACGTLLVGGLRPTDLIARRLAAGRTVLYMSERWFKPIPLPHFPNVLLPGWLRLLSPAYFRRARRFVGFFRSPRYRYLPIGPWAARDMRLLFRVCHPWTSRARLSELTSSFIPWGYFVAPSAHSSNRKIENSKIPPPVCVLLEPSGTRLGNWMFQYAAARTAAPGAQISFLVRNRAEWPAVERRRELFPGVPIVDRAPEGAVVRRGLFQDARCVSPPVVREIYRCPPRVAAYLEKTYGDLLSRPDLVSVHVRRGDYLGLPHRHPFVGERYLRAAVARVRAAVPHPTFVVCSDDLPWCRAFFSSARFPGCDFHFAAEDGGVTGDLFLMTRCRHHICSNSTFSWWGAYIGLANRRSPAADSQAPVTIFPSMWFGLQLRHEDWQGLYFDGCTVLHNGYAPAMLAQALALMAKNACGDILRALHLRKRRASA